MSVFDANGRLPLTLDRLDLRGDLPFADRLADEVVKDIVAYGIVCAPKGRDIESCESIFGFYTGNHRALTQHSYRKWFATESGVSLMDNVILATSGRRNLLISASRGSSRCRIATDQPFLLVHHPTLPEGKTVTRDWLREMLVGDQRTLLSARPVAAQVLLGKQWSGDKDFFEALPKFVQRECREIADFPNAKLYSSNPGHGGFAFDLAGFVASKEADVPNDVRIAEWIIAEPEDKHGGSLVAKVWHEVVPDVIPFDPDARKKMRDGVYEQLAQFIDFWESQVSDG